MAAVQHGHIDLTGKSQLTFPIRLGATISHPSDATHFSTLRYNHKPVGKQTGHVTASIGHRTEANELVLEAEDGCYTYRGKYAQDPESFVLVLRGEGKEREFVLERLDGIHGFNLVGTPTEDDAAKLEQSHPLLSDAPGDDDLFGDNDAEAPPDASNPFDYRHFLKAELEKPEPTQSLTESSRSTLGTPVVQPAVRNTPAARPVKPAAKAKAPAKRKPAAERSNSKRAKAGPERVAEAEPAKPKPAKAKPELPKVRVDRQASTRRASLDESGELILENETPVTENAPRAAGAMAWALSSGLTAGPISLVSAASSPGLASPAPEKEEVEVQEYEFDFGDASEVEDEQDDSELVLENGGGGGGDDAEAEAEADDNDDDDDDGEVALDDADADVDEHLELPSPAQSQRPSMSSAPMVGEEDDDDMEKQLALAMAADDEEEESEEE